MFLSIGRLLKPSSFTTIFFVLVFGYISSSAKAATIVVPAGGDLQAAINASQCKDIIAVQAGATWDVASPYLLPNKGCGAGTEITVTTTGALPLARVSPSNASSMPRFRATSSDGVFRTAVNAGYWILDGLNMTDNNGTGTVNYLVDIAQTYSGGNHITVQRSLMYPKEALTAPTNYNRALARGVWFEGSYCTFKWNYGYGFTQRDGTGQSQNSSVILTITGNNLTITDNFLEGGYVSFFTGGGGESPEYTANLSAASPTQANFSTTTGLVPGTTYVRFELQGSGTFNSSTSFTRTSGATPTSADINHTVFISKPGQTWRAKITAVSGNTWTLESYGGSQPNPGDTCTWVEYIVAKVTNVSGSTVTYDGSQATVGKNWLTQTPSTANAGWRLNQVVHDITVTRNTFNIDPVSAQYEHTVHDNNPKAWMELKAGDNVLIDGNYFTGYPSVIGVTQHSNEGWTPWTKIKNLTISNNFVNSIFDANGSRQFVILALTDPYNSDEPGCCTTITNNLVLNCVNVMQSSSNNTTSVTHNTIINDHPSAVYGSATVFAEGGAAYSWAFMDNIAAYNDYGMSCQISPNTLATCFPTGQFNHNVIVDNRGASVTTSSLGANSILGPIKTDFSQVGFVNTGTNDYRLSSGSVFKGAGTGGTDPGVNWTTLVNGLGFDPTGATVLPTPTPTPTPSPTATPTPPPTAPPPTPTPTPEPLTVRITNPGTSTTYSFGTGIPVSAVAADTAGIVNSVAFYAGTQLIGTKTLAPYNVVWNNAAAGSYALTAIARDSRGVAVTSNAVTIRISKALGSVRNGKKNTGTLAGSYSGTGTNSLSTEATQTSALMDSLLLDLEQTYNDFTEERVMFASASQIDKYLFAAMFLARSSAALSKQPSAATGVVDRLKKIDSYLSFCEDLMAAGEISTSTLAAADRVNARTDVRVVQPTTSPVASSGPMLLPNGMAQVSINPATPFTTQTAVANGGNVYELADVSVTIAGQAAPVLSVSPTQINFSVPGDLAGGLADIIVTSQEGFISHGAASVNGLDLKIFAPAGDTSGRGAILDALTFQSGTFSTTTARLMGLDARTRLSIWASGISSGISNMDFSNDIWLSNGRRLENLAESVAVEANTTDGRTFRLPVEYAGAQGSLPGLDQVNVVLVPELAGAGTVQISVLIGSVRSNMVTIVVR